MLGILYRSRILGESADNLDNSIRAFEESLTVFNRSSSPQYWLDAWNGLKNAHRERAEIHRTRGEFAASVANYTKPIELDPKEAPLFSGRGNVHREMGDLDRAISDFGQAIELNPKDAEAYEARTSCLLKIGRAREGISDANQSLNLRSDDAQTLNTRAHIFEVLNRREDAVADYRRILALALQTQSALRTDSNDALKRLGAAVSAAPGGREFYVPSGKLDHPEQH